MSHARTHHPRAHDRTDAETLPAYVVGYLRELAFGDDIVEYMRHIDATLEPYGGRFLVHGGRVDAFEGTWDGDLVMLAFPDMERAHAWYRSDAYQALVPLRTSHSESMVAAVEGVRPGHLATAKLAQILQA